MVLLKAVCDGHEKILELTKDNEIYLDYMKIKILLECLDINCKYFTGDRLDGCQRTEEYHFINCNGNIKECDLEFIELKELEQKLNKL